MRRSALLALALFACLATVGCTTTAPTSGTGPATVAAPTLVGLDRGQAQAALDAAGLKLGIVAEQYDASAAAGTVASQSPAPGTQTPQGSSVSIVLSKGPSSVAVPKVTGKTEADATALLEAAGFAVRSKTKNDKAKKGTVIAQAPSAGETGKPGSTVTITVSTGIVMVRVPNVEGMIDPGPVLKRAGLRPKGIAIHGPIESDAGDYMRAYRQRPRAGTMVPKGTTVTYHYWWEYG